MFISSLICFMIRSSLFSCKCNVLFLISQCFFSKIWFLIYLLSYCLSELNVKRIIWLPIKKEKVATFSFICASNEYIIKKEKDYVSNNNTYYRRKTYNQIL